MKKKGKSGILDFNYNKTKIKWVILVASILISAGSIYYTNYLVGKLSDREKRLIELFAKSLEYTSNQAYFEENINFITQEILLRNDEIPVIWTDDKDQIQDSKNVVFQTDIGPEDKLRLEKIELEKMKSNSEPIVITLKDELGNIDGYQNVYYRNSFLLRQLIYYPYIQLSVIAIFGCIVYFIFNYSKAAEQNRVWVGLAKETAHQLGTPISSLMAWVEFFKEDPDIKAKGIVEELDKDVAKLQLITERFSSIGSVPVLKSENLEELINKTVAYLRPRISTKVEINVVSRSRHTYAKVNAPLFEWVIENLCKNAVDAMSGIGKIDIKIGFEKDDKVNIDISDTGKGIHKSKLKQVFNAGFTTKKRGWGLGLTLVKRIIEVYHKGKIFVKTSEENKGTTFRIVLSN